MMKPDLGDSKLCLKHASQRRLSLLSTVSKTRELAAVSFSPFLKGTKRQHSGQMSQVFKTVKNIELQPVRPTELCGKVLSEKNGQKSVKTPLLLSNVIDADHQKTAVCLQTKAIFHHLVGF